MRITKPGYNGQQATIAATGNKLRINGKVFTISADRYTNDYFKVNDSSGKLVAHAIKFDVWSAYTNDDELGFVQHDHKNRNAAIAQLLFNIV